jgi:alanine racemase
VVKANAYGHGIEAMVPLAAENGVDVLGVHAIEEAARVRAAGWTGPVLLLGPTAPEALPRVRELAVETIVLDLETLAALDELGDPAHPTGVHLKLETGTWRQGIAADDLPSFLETLSRARGARLAGVSMHFANIEDTTDHTFARTQLARFRELSDPLAARGPGVVRHTACTAAVLTMPQTHFDMVRIGIGSYGYWPSRETQVSCRAAHPEREIALRPVLTWKARIGQLRDAPAGAYVGYGCSDRLGRETRMAVLPVGYSDGYDRGLSRLGHVLVRNRRAPVLGRICMNITMVDVTDVPGVHARDEVVLLGRGGEEAILASHLGEQIQTLSYEVLARLSPGLARFVVREDGTLWTAAPGGGLRTAS